MKIRKTLILFALVTMSTSVMGQASYTDKDGNEYQYKKHWFLDLQGGAQYTVGETSFTDLLSPNVQLGIGYQFNPVIGLRLQANAWQSKGAISTYQGTQCFNWNYVAPGIDVMFNLSNLICGWNPNRVFTVTAFLGGGLNIAWANDDANSLPAKYTIIAGGDENLSHLWDGTKMLPYGRAGLDLNFRLSDAVSLMVEGNFNVLNDQYNSKHADNADFYVNGLIGLRINLGKTYTKKEPAPEPIPEPVQPVVESTPTPAPAPVVEKIEPMRRDVFFTINSTVIVDQEMVKVEEIANYLKKYPNAKVQVSGYADKGTGTAKINARLAAQRADIVVNTLKEKYGIDASRISYDSYGDTVQPFAENDLNRVSICVANPE